MFGKVSKFQKGFKLSFSIMEWMTEMEKEVVEYIKLLNCDMVEFKQKQQQQHIVDCFTSLCAYVSIIALHTHTYINTPYLSICVDLRKLFRNYLKI